MYAGSLSAGYDCELQLGVSTSGNYNTSVIQFNYAGSGSGGFSGNNLGLGLSYSNNVMQIYTNGVKVTNTANTGNPFLFNIVTPNLGAGSYAEMHIGVAESNYNTGIINFNYAGAGSSGSNGNSLGLGLYGGFNLVKIYSNVVTIGGELDINAPGTSGYLSAAKMFAPSLTAGGNNIEIYLGVANSNYNCGIFQFNYDVANGSGASGNSVGIGFFGSNNVLLVYTSGIKINGSITKSSGSFDIPHPDPVKEKQRYRLRHCFVESNTRGDNLYRYTVATSGCKAQIRLPDYFKYLNENPQVVVSAIDVLGVCRGWIDIEMEHIYISRLQ
jgi:hypothetical protein